MANPQTMSPWEAEVDKLIRRIITLLELVMDDPKASLLGMALSMVMTLYFDGEHELLLNVSQRAMETSAARRKLSGDVKERLEKLLFDDVPQHGEQ